STGRPGPASGAEWGDVRSRCRTARRGDVRIAARMKNASQRLLGKTGLRYNGNTIVPGAQTERRGGAGPVRGLLGGKDLTGRFTSPQTPIPPGPTPRCRTAHGNVTTSPPARVLSAWSVGSCVLSLRKRTEPSAKAKLAPPGWPLPKAQTRSSS